MWGALQEVISYGLTFLLLVALKQGSEPQAMSAADPQELRSPLIRSSQGRVRSESLTFFVPIATVYRLLLCRLLPVFIGFVAFPWGVDRFAAADGYTVSANVY